MKGDIPVIVLRSNNCVTNDPCAICGQRCDPDGTPDFFLKGTAALVCGSCARRYAPDLFKIQGRIHKDERMAWALCRQEDVFTGERYTEEEGEIKLKAVLTSFLQEECQVAPEKVEKLAVDILSPPCNRHWIQDPEPFQCPNEAPEPAPERSKT